MENKVVSSRGREKLTFDGYLYIYDRHSVCGTKIFWRCERKDECKARIHTRDGIILKTINNHSHDSSAAKIEAAKVITLIKQRAEATLEATSQVLTECVTAGSVISCGAQAALPRQEALKKMIRRKRNEISAVPPSPLSLEHLEIPEGYTTYKCSHGSEETFLQADSGRTPQRILIFGRKNNLKVGTF